MAARSPLRLSPLLLLSLPALLLAEKVGNQKTGRSPLQGGAEPARQPTPALEGQEEEEEECSALLQQHHGAAGVARAPETAALLDTSAAATKAGESDFPEKFEAEVESGNGELNDTALAFHTAIHKDIMAKAEAGKVASEDEAIAAANEITQAFARAANEAGESDFPEKFEAEVESGNGGLNDTALAFYTAINKDIMAKVEAGTIAAENDVTLDDKYKKAANKIMEAFAQAVNEAGESDFPEKFAAALRG